MRRLGVALLLLHLLVGAGYLAQNLGKVPHYGDTRGVVDTPTTPPGYVHLAAEGESDPRRGLLYAPFLRAIHALAGGPWTAGLRLEQLEPPRAPIACHAPAWQAAVQLAQLLLWAVALAVAGRALLAGRLPPPRARALLFGSLLLDPILVHAQLSLLPDGLALSACLVFLAGAVRWQRDGDAGGLLLLAAGTAVAAGVRPEKALVLPATAAALAAWGLLARRRLPPARGAVGAALTVGVALVMVLAQRGLARDEPAHWTPGEFLVHSRIAFPHATELQPLLPAPWRERFTPRLAEHYDSGLVGARQAVTWATDGDPAARAALSAELRRLALAERAPALAADVALDTLRNSVPAPSFLLLLARWWRAGAPPEHAVAQETAALWLWVMLAYHEPHWALAALLVSAAVLLTGLAAAALGRCWRAARGALDAWAPPLALVLVNAAAFALAQDLFELRYVLVAHLALLALAVRALLGDAWRARPSDAGAPPVDAAAAR